MEWVLECLDSPVYLIYIHEYTVCQSKFIISRLYLDTRQDWQSTKLVEWSLKVAFDPVRVWVVWEKLLQF